MSVGATETHTPQRGRDAGNLNEYVHIDHLIQVVLRMSGFNLVREYLTVFLYLRITGDHFVGYTRVKICSLQERCTNARGEAEEEAEGSVHCSTC